MSDEEVVVMADTVANSDNSHSDTTNNTHNNITQNSLDSSPPPDTVKQGVADECGHDVASNKKEIFNQKVGRKEIRERRRLENKDSFYTRSKTREQNDFAAIDLVRDMRVGNNLAEKPDIITHCHQRREQHRAEEVDEQLCEDEQQFGHRLVRNWVVDDVTADHWNTSLSNTGYKYEETTRYANMDTEQDEKHMLDTHAFQHLEGFPQFNPRHHGVGYHAREHERFSRDVHKCVAPTVNMMYKLAEYLQLEPDSEEADMFNAALEAMGAVNYFNKRLSAKIEAKKIDDPVLNQYMVHSWRSQHGTLLGDKPLAVVKNAQRLIAKRRRQRGDWNAYPFDTQITKPFKRKSQTPRKIKPKKTAL